ncbi:MAG: 50S ribosomal protein L17 [Candidatus Zixiibacteriota bacterium]
MMRHQRKVKKLSRTSSHRQAMMNNMVTSLFASRMIKTTESKAKELRRIADRLVSTAKEDTLAARRLVARSVKDRAVLKKLFTEIAPQFKSKPSGFTRVVKMGYRRGDSAMVAVVELLTEKPKIEKDAGKKKGSKKKEKEAAATEGKSKKEKSASAE